MADNSSGLNQVLSETSFLYGGNGGFRGGALRQMGGRSGLRRTLLAGLLRRPARARRRSDPFGAGAGLDRQGGAPRAAGLALGARRHVAGGGSQIGQGHFRGPAAGLVRGGAQGDPGFPARGDDDPRLPHARAPGGQTRSPGPGGKARHLRTGSGHLRFRPNDYDRPIFLDFVLGLETSTIREIVSILRRTYCGTFAVQYMHISDPQEKALAPATDREARTRRSSSPARARSPSSRS